MSTILKNHTKDTNFKINLLLVSVLAVIFKKDTSRKDNEINNLDKTIVALRDNLSRYDNNSEPAVTTEIITPTENKPKYATDVDIATYESKELGFKVNAVRGLSTDYKCLTENGSDYFLGIADPKKQNAILLEPARQDNPNLQLPGNFKDVEYFTN